MTESIQSQGTLHSIKKVGEVHTWYVHKNRKVTSYDCLIGQEDMPPVVHSTNLKDLWFDNIMFELKQMNAENAFMDGFYKYFSSSGNNAVQVAVPWGAPPRFYELVLLINDMSTADKQALYDKMMPF